MISQDAVCDHVVFQTDRCDATFARVIRHSYWQPVVSLSALPSNVETRLLGAFCARRREGLMGTQFAVQLRINRIFNRKIKGTELTSQIL